jgi:hypothetical protein
MSWIRIPVALLVSLAAVPALEAGVLSGTVRSTEGGALAGMGVQAWAAAAATPVTTTSSATGGWTLSLPAGSYRLLAWDPAGVRATDFHRGASSFGGSTLVGVADCTDLAGVDFDLSPAGYLAGAVLDGATGAPLAGLTVAALNADGTVRGRATSSAAGTFVLALPEGSYLLGVWDDRLGWAPMFAPGTALFSEALAIGVMAGGTTATAPLGLLRAGSVAGTLVDAFVGDPLAGLTAELYLPDGSVRARAVSDGAGEYRLAAAPGAYRLVVSDPGGRYRTAFWNASTFEASPPIEVVAGQTAGAGRLALFPAVSATRGERFVAAAAHAPGANGTFFTTDLTVLNASPAATASVSLSFLRTGGGGNSGPPTVTREIPPGAQLAVVDVLRTLFGTTGAGAIRVVSEVPVAVASVTGTPAGDLAPGGRFGLGVPGRRRETALLRGRIPGITVDAALRTNVGVLNPGPAPISIHLRLSGSTGENLAEGSIALGPLGHFQASTIAAYLGITAPLRNASLLLSSASPFFAYATVIDQVTGDGSWVEPEPE